MEQNFYPSLIVIYVVSQLLLKNFQTYKVAKFKPLYKIGCLTQPCSYRPISWLPLLSKVMEKAIHDQIKTFLNLKDLLYTHQSGLRKKYSTVFCTSYLHDKILKELGKSMMTGMILIDLQKASHLIHHSALL